MMEIENVLRSVPARVVFVLPRLLEFMFRALQEYAFGLIFGALDRKAWMLWEVLSLEFGDVLPHYALEMPPALVAPPVDYAEVW